MLTVSRRKGFLTTPLHRRKEPHAFHYLSQRVSFWVAVMSLFAFVTGNMMGQHGWHVFWKSVLGRSDDSLIVYDGTVPPITLVPDHERWTEYGGGLEEHTYRQIPKDILVPLPKYNAVRGSGEPGTHDVFAIAHLGTYETGAGEGAHTGVDITVPTGTPVHAIGNGIVERIDEDAGGFGKYVVLRHPNFPDPANPTQTTVLHSVYAHLSAVLISEGIVVRKGDQIGVSGSTGNVTGPHLHFQIDRDEAAWHPYWPFTTAELREAGLSFTEAINSGFHRERGLQYTVDPMLFVQANYPTIGPLVASVTLDIVPTVSHRRGGRQDRMSLLARREERMRLRESRRIALRRAMVVGEQGPPVAVQKQDLVASLESTPQQVAPQIVASVDIRHDGRFARGWEDVDIALLGTDGRVIRSPSLNADLTLRTAYGSATFRPEALSPLDFQNGIARVQVLPHGRTTVVIQVFPYGTLSAPMRYGD